MYLDTAITPTRHAIFIKMAVMVLVVILMGVAGVAWWVYGLVAVAFIVCLWFDGRQAPLYELSASHPDELWYLGVYDEAEREVWQAYLQKAERVGGAMKLTFYVVVPDEVSYEVIIHQTAICDEDFAKLSALVWAKFDE